MEYKVNGTSISGSGNHKLNTSQSSANGVLICAQEKSTFRLVSKENMKQASEAKLLKDRISELPAEVVVDILSQLKTKEAGSTSILSRKWRYMWTTIYNLNFDGSEVLNHVERKLKCLKLERPIYVSCVNEALRRHQGQTIDQFAVVFSLDDSSRSDIDRWVSFALRKRVQRLKLNLRNGKFTQSNCYRFPDSLDISSCSSLTSLYLDTVNIDGEMLQLFLSNCLNLERLFVSGSRSLQSLNVHVGPSFKLKWLELYMCPKVESLSVSASNLVSFKYVGPTLPLMPLKDVPNLLEISIWSFYGSHLNSRLFELSGYVSQLEQLTLDACILEKHTKDVIFPVFPKLKHLKLIISAARFVSIVDYASLINVCPSLYCFSFQSWSFYDPDRGIEPPKAQASINSIRVVEFIDFRGHAVEIEAAMYLIDNSVSLEKITFDVVKRREYGGPSLMATECARELGKTLRPGVEMAII